jgi:hypothetical protein
LFTDEGVDESPTVKHSIGEAQILSDIWKIGISVNIDKLLKGLFDIGLKPQKYRVIERERQQKDSLNKAFICRENKSDILPLILFSVEGGI